MQGKVRPVPVDYAGLADYLVALGYPARLELLDLLRFPHTLNEIRLSPHRALPGGNPDRVVARQTLQAHLDRLVETGLVGAEAIEEDGRQVHRYSVNPQKLYAFTEELRRLSTRYAGGGTDVELTGTLVQEHRPTRGHGPRLVLVHGLYEGKTFPLEPKAAVDGRWTIGRRRDLPVSLDYDPYVSLENSVLAFDGGAYHLTGLPESKNGTTLNWVRLEPGEAWPLHSGDVVGVGRSLLNFVER